jgi:hypothetical protein
VNCLISDAPSWRAIDSMFDGVCDDAEVLVLASAVRATDLVGTVLKHPAVRGRQVTVVSDRSEFSDPVVDLLDPSIYHQSWIRCQTPDGQRLPFRGNVVVIHSDGDVRAAIGSAPLAAGRWCSDGEVWGTIHGRCGIAPVALHDLAELLQMLCGSVQSRASEGVDFLLDAPGKFALYTAAAEIAGNDAVNTHARVLNNLDLPIVDLLRGNVPLPVKDLVVYAPVYHHDLQGVDVLINTLRPTGSTTIYTDRRPDRGTVVERAAADGMARSVYIDRAIRKRRDTPNATVVQWRDGEDTWTLTGLSLIDDDTLACSATHDGVPVQVALLSQTDKPLLPWADHIQPHWQTRVLATPDLNPNR